MIRNQQTLRSALLWAVANALLASPAQVHAEEFVSLRVRDMAVVADEPLRLRDLLHPVGNAEIAEVLELHFSEIEAAPLGDGVSHQEILERLISLGLNPAEFVLSGPSICRVVHASAPDSPACGGAAPTRDPAGGADCRTLAEIVTQCVERNCPEGARPELEFERSGESLLKLTSPPWDFDVQLANEDDAGLREFRVTLRRDGRVQRTVHLGARVRFSQEVVVAARPLAAGSVIQQADLRMESRLLERATNPDWQIPALLGQKVKRFVPEGQAVRREDIEPVELVRRGRPVTLAGATGEVTLRLTGTALDSGNYGEIVRVRIGESRREQRVLRGTVIGVGAVALRPEGVQ